MRWYGDELANIQPYLELKQKRNLLGRKERYLLPCKLDLTLSWGEILQVIRAETRLFPSSLVSMLQTVNQPTLLNRYQREYYTTMDGTIRVTLDFAQVAYDQRLAPRPNLRVRLPIADTVVIEVKTGRDHAERLHEIVSWFPLRRSRNSKYAGSLLVALG